MLLSLHWNKIFSSYIIILLQDINAGLIDLKGTCAAKSVKPYYENICLNLALGILKRNYLTDCVLLFASLFLTTLKTIVACLPLACLSLPLFDLSISDLKLSELAIRLSFS